MMLDRQTVSTELRKLPSQATKMEVRGVAQKYKTYYLYLQKT